MWDDLGQGHTVLDGKKSCQFQFGGSVCLFIFCFHWQSEINEDTRSVFMLFCIIEFCRNMINVMSFK